MTYRKPTAEVVANLTGSPIPTTDEALEANETARELRADAEPAHVHRLDSLGREWAQTATGGWGAIGSTATADSLAEIADKYGPLEELS